MYAFVFHDKAIGPDGEITDVEGTPLPAKYADDYNRQVEEQELEHIRSGAENLFLYVKKVYVNEAKTSYQWRVSTFLGTVVCPHALVGDRQHIGFGFNSYRRAMSAYIMGRWYNGWYFESSGDYCRLKLAKRNYLNKHLPNEPNLGPWKLGK